MNETGPKHLCPECGLALPPAGTGRQRCPACSLRLALTSEATTPEPSRQVPEGLKSRFFGDYEILDEIARGGMGVVYRARQLSLTRQVALKMIQSHHLLSDETRLRFRVEIEAVAQLHHPHIVSLYESGEHDGAHYFTMRLVEGGDLSGLLAREGPVRSRIELLVKVCRAVHYAHQRGVLHRDLKPSNILVDQQGEPQVADFGLAKPVDQDGGFTFTSSVLGSPNYMSPEQAAGRTHQLTTSVDVYGLGAILYQILSGCPPFQAATPVETLRRVLDEEPEPPRSFRPRTDPDLETIALKCLRKEPAGRYGTAEELAADLERWLAGEPILARRLGPLAAVWRWSRRHPAAAGLGAALGLAVGAIVVGTGLAAVRIRHAEQKATLHLQESLLREASSLRLGSELGHRDEGLRRIREAVALGGPPEFLRRARNEALATLVRTQPRFVPTTLSNLEARVEWHGIHPSFEWVVSVRNGTNVLVRAFTNGVTLGRLARQEKPVTRLDAFSPNSQYLALWNDEDLSIWDLEHGTRCLVRTGTNCVFAFHPREHSVLIQNEPHEAVWFDLPTGQERARWTAPARRLSARPTGWHTLALSPDGRVLAGASGTSLLVEFLDSETGEQRRVVTNNASATALRWSPSGRTLAVATGDSKVVLWEAASGALQWMSPAMIAPAHSLAFHPQREWLAAACGDGKVRFIDTVQQRFVFEFAAETRSLTFSAGGGKLGPVWSEGKLGWLETRRSGSFAGFGIGPIWERLFDGSFSPDGRVLLVGHVDRVFLCDPQVGRRIRTEHHWRMATTVFHPQENFLLTTNADGIVRQPYTVTDAGRLTLADPELIHEGNSWRAFDFSPGGRFFAAFNARSNATLVFDYTLTNGMAALGPHPETGTVSIHPDGRWLTSGSPAERTLRLWDVRGSRLIQTFPTGPLPRGEFSRDGRWLAVTGDSLALLEAGTWKPAPALEFSEARPILGAAAFSPDSRRLAVVVNRFAVHLFDLRTFKSVGVLQPPGSVPMLGLTFSPDGGQLAGFGAEARVAVWNLRSIEDELAGLGLAWD